MVENQKLPKAEKEVSKPNGVELPHEVKVEKEKLTNAANRVAYIKTKQKIVGFIGTQYQEKKEAFDDLLSGFSSEAGENPKKNPDEKPEMQDPTELKKVRDDYQTQLKTTYQTHYKNLADKPEEQKSLGPQYLEGCIKDLQIDKKNPGDDDVRILATSIPATWKETLLNPKAAPKGSALEKVRDVILDRIADGAASIERGDFESDKAYQQALLDNFEDIAGFSVKYTGHLGILLGQLNNEESGNTPTKRILGVLQNTFGKKGSGNQGGFDDLNSGPVPDIGVCSEKFPSSEELQGAIQNISNDEGVSESKNPQRIGEYHAAAGLNAGPSTPWCMSFVQYMSRKYLGYKGPQTASARAGLSMGNKINNPEPGSIVITRGSGPSGCHIGICVGEGKYISGNSGNAVKIKAIPSGSQYRSLKPNSGLPTALA